MNTQSTDRIELHMSQQEIVTVMSATTPGNHNPGSIGVMMQLMHLSPLVDPDSGLGPYTPLLTLDSNRIYGARIYVLYNDVCKGRRPDPSMTPVKAAIRMLAVLRFKQMGLEHETKIPCKLEFDATYHEWIGNIGPFDDIIREVMKALPGFNRVPEDELTSSR